jgi:hypothetical protein
MSAVGLLLTVSLVNRSVGSRSRSTSRLVLAPSIHRDLGAVQRDLGEARTEAADLHVHALARHVARDLHARDAAQRFGDVLVGELADVFSGDGVLEADRFLLVFRRRQQAGAVAGDLDDRGVGLHGRGGLGRVRGCGGGFLGIGLVDEAGENAQAEYDLPALAAPPYGLLDHRCLLFAGLIASRCGNAEAGISVGVQGKRCQFSKTA